MTAIKTADLSRMAMLLDAKRRRAVSISLLCGRAKPGKIAGVEP
jgi:hypothetical protein